MQLFQIIEELFRHPPVKFNPGTQSLKNWAMYCLRDRGFIVVYAQNADFALEQKGKDKIYFKMAQPGDDLDGKFAWLVLDIATNNVSFIPPQA